MDVKPQAKLCKCEWDDGEREREREKNDWELMNVYIFWSEQHIIVIR